MTFYKVDTVGQALKSYTLTLLLGVMIGGAAVGYAAYKLHDFSERKPSVQSELEDRIHIYLNSK